MFYLRRLVFRPICFTVSTSTQAVSRQLVKSYTTHFDIDIDVIGTMKNNTKSKLMIYIYIYIYMCVCVCVCWCM